MTRDGARRDRDADAGIADEIPPDEIFIPAIEWIGERSLDGVGPEQIEKLGGPACETRGLILFDGREDRVLIGCRKLSESHAFRGLSIAVDRRQTGTVNRP